MEVKKLLLLSIVFIQVKSITSHQDHPNVRLEEGETLEGKSESKLQTIQYFPFRALVTPAEDQLGMNLNPTYTTTPLERYLQKSHKILQWIVFPSLLISLIVGILR